MNTEQIKLIQCIVETAVNNSNKYYWLFLLIAVLVVIAANFLSNYLSQKGENYATKQDIEGITKKIEGVKAQIQEQQNIETQKRQLKHDALLQSLTLIDAHLSHALPPSKGQKIKKQYASTEELRKCHNSLILTCEKAEVLEKFSAIMFGVKDSDEKKTAPTDLLNEYRNLVRMELGFGDIKKLDAEKAWVGYAIFERNNESDTETETNA